MEIMTTRVATTDDIDGIVDTITSAFFDDPLWAPEFPDAAQRAALASEFWRLSATSALRYPWTFVTEGLEAAAVWIPPEGSELTDDEEDGLDEFLVNLVGRTAADSILALYDEFERATPSEPHFYLSLLGTHDQHRGRGLGMNLLRDSLARIDELGAPAYLESSNPANNARYQSVGFRPVGQFAAPKGQVVTTMWRDASGTVAR